MASDWHTSRGYDPLSRQFGRSYRSFFDDDDPLYGTSSKSRPRTRATTIRRVDHGPRLDKFERNAAYRTIEKAGLSLGDFKLRPRGRRHFTLTHAGGAEFKVEPVRLGLVLVEASWGEGHERERPSVSWRLSLWAWLRRVRREIETPDLWAEFKAEQELLDSSPADATDNTVFTHEEQAEIREQLERIRAHALSSGDFTDDELARLNAKLDKLVESSRRASRFDWHEQVVGALLGAIAGNLLPQVATLEVLQMTIRSVGHLFGQPGLLPP